MPNLLALLEEMPNASEFYADYWNRRPFVVRGGVSQDSMAGLITANELAGLAMEDAPLSRMVKTEGDQHGWSCRFGPFSELDFETAGDTDWSLLIQNVEQFHPGTSSLLRHFNFSPRWLMDDIMVSFSTPGGSVGPHLDSYHVFLVQGRGKRRWKVSQRPIEEEVYIEGLEMKVLASDFDGDEVEVSTGDVLYIPPRFGHQGTTTETSLTFSVGFLGPKLSELMNGYAQYLADAEDTDRRYVGDNLDSASGGFNISRDASDNIRSHLQSLLISEEFNQWLVEFFTASSHDNFGNYDQRDAPLNINEFSNSLDQGTGLTKPEYVKFAITASPSGEFFLGFDCHSFTLNESMFPLVQILMKEQVVSGESYPQLFDHPATVELLLELYNHQALEFI